MTPRPPTSTLFPYTTLFRSQVCPGRWSSRQTNAPSLKVIAVREGSNSSGSLRVEDRKSTRLNSSHPSISYAVFCLKKKIGARRNRQARRRARRRLLHRGGRG